MPNFSSTSLSCRNWSPNYSVLVCFAVRGYLPVSSDARRNLMNMDMEQESIRELAQRKNNLELELRNYAENDKLGKLGKGTVAEAIINRVSSAVSGGTRSIGANAEMAASAAMESMGVIPAQTQLSTALAINLGTDGKPAHVEVSLSTSNETIIRSVLIFAEGIFEGECHVIHPKEPATTINVPIFPPKDIPVDLHIKAFVGNKGSAHYHVFELTRQLPRFAMYCRLLEQSGTPEPEGRVQFKLNERAARVALWLNQNFLMGEELESTDGKIEVAFSSLRAKNQVSEQISGRLIELLYLHYPLPGAPPHNGARRHHAVALRRHGRLRRCYPGPFRLPGPRGSLLRLRLPRGDLRARDNVDVGRRVTERETETVGRDGGSLGND
jgi:hypothetical protein